jgi:hypothetical protein
MDALGSGSIPQLVPVPPAAAAAAPPPLPPAPIDGSGSASATGPTDICELPKLRLLRPRPRRRAKLPSFHVAPAGLEDANEGDPQTPEALKFSGSGARTLARAVSNSSASSGGRSYRRCSSSNDFSCSTPSVSPFAAYSDTPFEDDDGF